MSEPVAVPELEMKLIALDAILPYQNNPRQNEDAVQGVADSIKAFGFNVPIVVDSDMVVITGHTRLKAAHLLNLTQAPVIIATHLTPEQVAAYRIADNRVAENAKWDNEKLSEELQILQSMGIDLIETGFSMEEISCLLDNVSADCLEDLSAQAVCGDVNHLVINKNKEAGFTLGDFRFLVPLEQYNKWRMAMLETHGSANDMIVWVKEQIGINKFGA